MSIQIAANVSGFDPSRDEVPKLFNDSPAVPAGVWSFDPGNTRGHWSFNDGIPSNGWTLIAGLTNQRVWLTLTDDHQPLAPGSYELALLKSDPGQPPMPGVLVYQLPAPAIVTVDPSSTVDLICNGQRWVERGATAFCAFLKAGIMGVAPTWYQGAEVHRVMLTLADIPRQAGWPVLDPDANGAAGRSRYFQALDGFFQETQGVTRLNVCVLADLQLMGHDNQAWATAFVNDVVNVMRPYTHLTFDLGNEPWNTVNGWKREWFPNRPDLPFLCTNGSFQDAGGAGSSGYDDGPSWDCYRVHPRREGPELEWKGLAHCMLAAPSFTYGKAVINDEGMKFGEVYQQGKQYTDPRIARINGQAMRAANGGSFHSDAGCFDNPLGPVAESCRAAFFG